MSAFLASPVEIAPFCNPSSVTTFFNEKEKKAINEFSKKREMPLIGKPGQSCENNLFFGFFFDGTRNSYALDEESPGSNTHSNISRLFDAYPGKPLAPLRVLSKGVAWDDESQYPNYFRVYTPGVGMRRPPNSPDMDYRLSYG